MGYQKCGAFPSFNRMRQQVLAGEFVAVDAQRLVFCFNNRQRSRTSCSSAKKSGERLCPTINIALNCWSLTSTGVFQISSAMKLFTIFHRSLNSWASCLVIDFIAALVAG